MITCSHCQDTARQVKAGFTHKGSQRFQCQLCRRQYTSEPLPLGYDDQTKAMALKFYLEGNGFRRIGRLLSVNHQSVVNWVNAFHAQLRAKKLALPVPGQVSTLGNWRQLRRQHRPRYPINLIDSVSSLI
jgi:transposase-like protein